MKLPLKVLFALFVLLLAVSCGNDRATQPAAGPVIKAGPGPVAGTQDRGGRLRFLTTRYRTQDAALIETFEREYGIDVQVIVKPVGEIVAAAARGEVPAGDVVLLPTLEDAVRLKGFEVLQPFFVNAFTGGEVGDKYLDNEGYWSGLTQWTMVSVYDPLIVSKDEASSYQGLVMAANRGVRVGVAHPDSSGLAGVVAGLNQGVSPQAATAWAEFIFRKAAGGVGGSDSDQMDRLQRREIDLAFVSLGAATRWMLNGNPANFEAGKRWRIRYPRTQKDNANFFNMTCLVMPAGTPNREAAVTFIDYLYREAVQTQLSTNWFEYPVQVYAKTEDYVLQNMQDVGRKLYGETLEQNIPAAWTIINQTVAKVQ